VTECAGVLVCCDAGTPVGKTPGMMGSATMSDTPMTFDPAAIQRAAADLPNSVLNTLQQVTGQHTPYQPFQVQTNTHTRAGVTSSLSLTCQPTALVLLTDKDPVMYPLCCVVAQW